MSDMLIRIDTEKAIADIEARLGMLYEKAPDVMRKSLNDTAKKTGRELAKLAQERYQIKTIKFAKEFKYTYASKSRLEAVLTSSGEMLAASKFKISPTKPSTSKEGSPPVKLAVLASESPKTITNSRSLTAFLAEYQSGHLAVVQRKPYGSRTEYTERGWREREQRNHVFKELTGKLDKTRIREFYGPSVPVMLRETGIAEQFIETTEPKIHQYLADAITTHINRELYFAEKK
mgnify:FL=1